MSSKSYAVQKNEGYTVINFEGELDYNQCKVFDEEVDSISANGDTHVLINCENITSLPKDWLRAFLRMHINLKKDNKFLKLIHVNLALMNYLKKEGIDTTFKIAKDLRDALNEVGLAPKRTLDTEFINPFLTATMHVLKVQATIEAKPGKVHMKKPGDQSFGDVSGVIGIVSDSFNGSVVISFPENTFLKIMSSMLGEEYTKLDKEIIDGAGELTNMIFGQAKITLNEKGYGIKTAIPSVVSGKNHTLSAQSKGPVVVVPFESTAGNFFVEICLSN
jgi:chemotaxis protein CheX